MIDQQYLYKKQISDFLNEHKNRFTAVNIQGKSGYSTKLNKQESITLFVVFSEKFPLEAPLVYVSPKFESDIIDNNGRVKDDSVIIWNINSSLKSAMTTILTKLESTTQTNQIKSNQRVSNSASDNEISVDIKKELESKSIEELIYINFNQEEFINDYTKKFSASTNGLTNETNLVAEKLEKVKAQYDNIKGVLSKFQPAYEEKANQLRQLSQEKMNLDNKFTIESLQNEIRKFIEEDVKKPKDKVINDFLSKRIDFNTFQESFKGICAKYHYFMIVNEKLASLAKC